MKHYLFIACLFLVTLGYAQSPNTKWGKPTQAEWDLQAWGEAPDAEAVILNRTMELTYEIKRQFASYTAANTDLDMQSLNSLGTNENGLMTANYENKLRIKILKDSGAGYANIDVIYLDENGGSRLTDEPESVKVTVFSKNEKGKIVKRIIKNDTFKRERINDNYKVLQVRVPDVKAGDIIEYQYAISSSRVTFLYDCSFQEEIPVLYAKCDMDIPALLQFDMKVPIHPFIKSKVERGIARATQSSSDMQAAKTYPTNHYIIEGHDILPKGLDLQRNNSNIEAAKVNTNPGKIMQTFALIKGMNAMVEPLPEGKNHIMVNP